MGAKTDGQGVRPASIPNDIASFLLLLSKFPLSCEQLQATKSLFLLFFRTKNKP
jgi:hypothetical protein